MGYAVIQWYDSKSNQWSDPKICSDEEIAIRYRERMRCGPIKRTKTECVEAYWRYNNYFKNENY